MTVLIDTTIIFIEICKLLPKTMPTAKFRNEVALSDIARILDLLEHDVRDIGP